MIVSPTSPIIWTSEVPLTPLSPLSPLTVDFTYNKPLVGIYETIDTNIRTKQLMVNHYYYKILDHWLYNELSDILNYFLYADGKISLIKNITEYKNNNTEFDTDKIAEKKVDYIQDHILSKHRVAELLAKFTRETGTKWVDLPRHEFELRMATREYLKRLIKKKIKKSE